MVRFSSYNAILSLLLLLAIFCNLGLCELKASSCNEKDKQILLCFKHGLTDPSGMLSTWSSSKEDCCEWTGVQCDVVTGRVTNLNLPCSTDDFIYGIGKDKSHCLTGEFHLSLFELQYLKYLNLSNNNFKSVQKSLECQNLPLVHTPHGHWSGRNSSNLVYLDLSENENLVIDDLRWLLPLSSLEHLDLSFIDLHKQTQWLQMLTMLPSLSQLHLVSCMLESASPSLDYANFNSLEYLDLSYNNFISELPNWLFNLSGLHYINLRDNHFHGQIPKTLLNLKNLYFLSLKGNMLSETIPEWLGQLGSLKYLRLSQNLFTGPIPKTLGNLSSLIYFNVVSNHLNGNLPESFGQLSNLEMLLVGENSFSGVVSHRNFVNLTKLQILYLGSPSFIFDFDSHWVPPFKLDELLLEYVDLKLLPWLYTQKSLSILDISYSSFTHESPNKFWSWAADIEHIFLQYNSMHWDMSNVLLNSEIIHLKTNGLNGGLPRLTSNVKYLNIGVNNFSGPLSPLLCHKMKLGNNLQFLDMSDNLLFGGLTNCWENWKSLVHINLGRNDLTGMIPHSFGILSNLSSLHLDNNKLYGEIPLSLKNCQKLMILNLCENKFSGNIPNWMSQNVKAIQLRSNEFSGDIPLQICQLSSLTVLDVANNRLSGTIPDCLNNITAMVFNDALILQHIFGANHDEKRFPAFKIVYKNAEVFFVIYPLMAVFELPLVTKGNKLWYIEYAKVIDLSSNHLFGNIPLEVFKLTGLQSLNLSQNQLGGTIPEELGNLKQLESLDFSNNMLSGEIPQTMSTLSFLDALNLSFNNFRGQIPLGTQLQRFTTLSYIGNPELCGTPLQKHCFHDEAPSDTKSIGKDEEDLELLDLDWFYMGMGVGFAISFWIVFGSLLCIRTWRHAYFKFLNDIKDQLYVKIMVKLHSFT